MRWSAFSLFGFLSLFAAIPSVHAAGEDYAVLECLNTSDDGLAMIEAAEIAGSQPSPPMIAVAGQRHFGENRVQEAAAKWPELRAETLIEGEVVGTGGASSSPRNLPPCIGSGSLPLSSSNRRAAMRPWSNTATDSTA